MTDLEQRAREIAEHWIDLADRKGIDAGVYDGLTEDILTALRTLQSETIERAAKVADDEATDRDSVNAADCVATARDIAARIRALNKEGE